ncbi:MAG: methylmalonyl-CoA epimerase [Flavobacteriaceae bacterium]|nr:methylmalonyl-CoA epimerase [Flavobacteriaceae bacterium]
MNKIEHIGIAVKNIKEATETYEALLNKKPYKEEEVESEGVKTVFFETGESKIELLGATSDQSPIAKYLDKKGEGIHHIAFAVDDINFEIQRLEAKGFQLINQKAKPGADGKIIAFLHPKSNHGVLVELCQDA